MNRTLALQLATVSLALGTLVGCATDKSAKSSTEKRTTAPDAEKDRKGPERLTATAFDESCCKKIELDLNNDEIPDAYQFIKETTEGETLILRKEVDVNFDRRVDLLRTFSEDGELLTEELDFDFDGQIDVVNVFEKGLIVRKEYDTNFDQIVDLWRFYDKGVIARKEADLNHDGKVDYWEYYEQGKINRIGIDRDSDGIVDDWENNT